MFNTHRTNGLQRNVVQSAVVLLLVVSFIWTQNNNKHTELDAISALAKIYPSESPQAKPLAIIHVGPHKTGTTSLQQSIVDYYKKDILPSDNFTIPLVPNLPGSMWKKASWIAHCFGSQQDHDWYGCDSNHRNRIMEYFMSFLSNASATNTNILMSSEDFSRETVNMTLLKEYFKDFEIKVVVFYRRFYDWIQSFYNQKAKMNSKLPTFVEWIESDGNIKEMQEMYTAAVYDRYRVHFDVSILNMHDNSSLPILPTFFCQYVHRAHNSCEKAIENPNMRKSNPSSDALDHRHFWNAIGKTYPALNLKRMPNEADEVNAKFKELSGSYPRKCLSAEAKHNLLNLSIQYEKRITSPDWYNSDEGIQALTADFNEKSSSRLCSIDATAMLHSKDWKALFDDILEKSKSRF